MWFRALLAFLVLPGVVAFLAPPLIACVDPWRSGPWLPGVGMMALGTIVLLWCVRDFYVAGKGTLAPWSPPEHLVVVGLYRYCRNPMYVGVLTLVVGWALLFGSALVASYAVFLALGFHVRVLRHEEPWLQSRFPNAWPAYRASVPRWLPCKMPQMPWTREDPGAARPGDGSCGRSS